MKNFDYLKAVPHLSHLYAYCHVAEENQRSHPDVSALNARRALEWLVRSLYAMKEVELSERTSLFELVDGEPFREFLSDDRLMMGVHYIRKTGNNAAHTGVVTKRESFFTLLNLYNLVGSVLVKLQAIDQFEPFNEALLSDTAELYVQPQAEPQIDKAFVELHTPVAATPVATPPLDWNISEADTRRYFIDILLKEAGWHVLSNEGAIEPLKACIEVEVQGMPNDKSIGYVDYVLFGANGKPLAIVEAKRTSKGVIVGKHQAELYADCLEARYGVRPVIYYTNGYHTYIIDGLGYPAREVWGYHTANDLELLIQQRKRNAISDFSVKDSITDRHYQKSAVKAVCEHFNTQHRKALLVMSMGTGKTRVSISLVDVLMRNGWVKNVLFLADRTALVKQAHKNYVKLLPNTTTCVLSDGNNQTRDIQARIMFSTYQTMINYIDTDTKEFSIGRFDLIIIDEAHRSVFGKYGAIFNYFDSMLVGLTATPRDEVDRSTYQLFEMEQGVPNYAYELEEAVADHYLVPYQGFKRGSVILRDGIKYDSLSESEKAELEPVWQYEKARKALDSTHSFSRDISSDEIFQYLFNIDTIDKVLQDLMENGLKVTSGNKIGKTIIFAYNHLHAEKIVERFGVLYPQLGSDFCVLIDNYVTYAQSLIDAFEVRDKNPQIAVSVDMLDTGIDVPDVLNLVFFKIIKSKIKFFQMIGRGTRLSENIFGISTKKTEIGFGDKDKTCFYIFDWCGNFEYFSLNPKGKESKPMPSLTEHLFGIRADIAFALQHQTYQQDEFAKSLHDELKNLLHEQVESLNELHISVRQQWELVTKFRNADNWIYISQIDVLDLKERIAPLLVQNTVNEAACKFDLLILQIQLSLLDSTVKSEKSQQKVYDIANLLQEKASIPQVKAKMPLLQQMTKPIFWETISLDTLEHVRLEVRELIQYLFNIARQTFDINIEDTIIDAGETEPIFTQVSYKQKVFDFLAKHRDLPVLQKIINIEQLSHDDVKQLEKIFWEELGTKEEYEKYLTKQNLLFGDKVAVFIRSILGVNRSIAIKKFTDFISDESLNSQQEEYLKTIINYVCQNGDITKETILEVSPFDDFNWLDTFGQKFTYIPKYIDTIHYAVMA